MVPRHSPLNRENSSLLAISFGKREVAFSARPITGFEAHESCGLVSRTTSLFSSRPLTSLLDGGFFFPSGLQGTKRQEWSSSWLFFFLCSALLFLCPRPPCHSLCQFPNFSSPSLEDSAFFYPKISSLGHREAVYRPPSYPEVRIDYFIYLFLQSAGKVNCGDQSSNVKLIPKMLA